MKKNSNSKIDEQQEKKKKKKKKKYMIIITKNRPLPIGVYYSWNVCLFDQYPMLSLVRNIHE
jgi:hypothetical protein